MNETLHRLRMAFLLIVVAAGSGLLAWTTSPVAGPPQVEAGPVKAGPRQSQIAAPLASLEKTLAHPEFIPTHHHPLLGRRAPQFELADPEGKSCNLGELLERGPVVLVFYFGYHCIHCVRHLTEMSRDLPLFREVGAQVVAISADPPELTRQRIQQHAPFGFPVLADPGNKVGQAYGVFRPAQDEKIGDILRHGTFIIDSGGSIQWANVGDAPFRRNSALLYQLAKLKGGLP